MATKADRRRWALAQWELDNLNALTDTDRVWLADHGFRCDHLIGELEVELLMETVWP